ncbi:sensor histidine kinase [Aureimonas glaciei]|jgi:PAS domain S-box-containing protein|uniref:Blue-light-activated histidine kinase n=1 Tax=Aureimonas glaciei TaxID=1776957 RepID=A0A916XYG8_9HYPH|nr:HWE histidine kinase domain-containing protein [Aureimonas glaciei]GGD20959.1 hypothetical protein GCM10011335_24880 [Aureimonas glaciei]
MTPIDFERLFAVLPSPHMVLDSQLNFVAANSAYEAAVGRTQEELLGHNLFSLFPDEGDSGQRLRTSLRRVFDSGESDTIAYLRYDIPRAERDGGGLQTRYWSAVHIPLHDKAGKVAYVMQNTVDVTELAQRPPTSLLPFRTLSGETELLQRAREAEDAYRSSMSESADFKRLFQRAPAMVAILDGPSHVFSFANDAFQRFVGGRPLIGRDVRTAFPDIEGQGFYEMLRAVFVDAAAHNAEDQRIVLASPDGEGMREAYFDFAAHPIQDMHGAVTGIFVQGMDRTEHFQSLQRQRLLVDELNHRVKNTLATVQSIARQSFRDTGTEGARLAFEARIMALSKAHNVLSERHWETAKLSVLLEQELAAFEPSRIELSGPDVDLSPKAAIAFAMVFHELATNAAKFGALSPAAGSLSISWNRSGPEDHSMLALQWTETGTASSVQPLRRGRGMRLLKRIVEGELDGHLDLDLEPRGLICRLQVATQEVENLEESHA